MKHSISYLCLFALLFSACTKPPTASNPVELFLPGYTWSLRMDLADLKSQGWNINSEATVGRLAAENVKDPMNMTVFLEKMPSKMNSTDCRNYFHEKKLKTEPGNKTDIKMYPSPPFEVVEYTIPEYRGVEVRQRHLNAYAGRDDVCVDIHLSRVQYKPADQKKFDTVIRSASLNEISDVNAILAAASFFYLKQDLPKAIQMYERVMAMEAKKPSLAIDKWRVSVDNLGMAYGMSGDIKKAKEVFENGIRRDPKYPNFYYSLACTYAEMRDIDAAAKYLWEAYLRRDNMIRGETFPDPLSDPSFRPYLNDPKFKAVIGKMRGAGPTR